MTFTNSVFGNTIFVTPVPRTSAQGRGSYTTLDENGVEIPAPKNFGKGVQHRFKFPRDKSGEVLDTGMDELVTNPYYELKTPEEAGDKYKLVDNWYHKFDDLKTKEKISKQMLFEILAKVPPGSYNPKCQVKSMAKASRKSLENWEPSILESFVVFLGEGTHTFRSDTVRGRLAIQVILKNTKKIAKSREEIRPGHTFYISNIDEVTEQKAKVRNSHMSVMGKMANFLEKADEFVIYQMGIALNVISGIDVKQNLVTEALTNYVYEAKKNKTGTLQERLSNFISLHKLATDVSGMRVLYIKYLLTQAIHFNLIYRDSGIFKWRSQRGTANFELGSKIESIEKFFLKEYEKHLDEIQDNVYIDLERELSENNVRIK